MGKGFLKKQKSTVHYSYIAQSTFVTNSPVKVSDVLLLTLLLLASFIVCLSHWAQGILLAQLALEWE